MRLGANVLLGAAVAGLILLVVLAVNAAQASACSQCQALFVAQRSPQTAAICDFVQVIGAAGATDAYRAANCAADGASGDQLGSPHCCDGHGPTCGGGAVAPATANLVSPSLSRDRLRVKARAMAGVSRPPDERPPRRI